MIDEADRDGDGEVNEARGRQSLRSLRRPIGRVLAHHEEDAPWT